MSDVAGRVEQLVAGGEDPDDVLRAVVAALVDGGAARWAGISFVEDGALVLGPQAGTPNPAARAVVPVAYEGTHVADLAAEGCSDLTLLERVAALIGLQCLVAWDTGGVPWDETPA